MWRWFFVIALIPIVIGWRPRVTCIPHWILATWLANTIAVPDGGDHLAQAATFLLIPLCLVDDRKWAWSHHNTDGRVARFYSELSYVLLRCQLFVLYAWAAVAKALVPEWVDGTAVWFWSQQIAFGFPAEIRLFSDHVLANSWGVILITFGAVLTEAALALAAVRGGPIQLVAYPLGLALHLSIAIAMGLMSFFFSTAGLLTLVFAVSIRRDKRVSVDFERYMRTIWAAVVAVFSGAIVYIFAARMGGFAVGLVAFIAWIAGGKVVKDRVLRQR